ncbi:MAG: hypothetical protein Kow0088_11300 [Anaerolineales bacterium]
MTLGKSPPVKTAAVTHAGMSGKNNEDRFRLHRFITKKRQEAVLAVVADGIGGHRAGEIAAELASEQIIRSVSELDVKHPILTLRQAIQDANQIVLAGGQANPNWAGMGTTCACALVIGNRLYTATAGDSRIYLLRGKRIFQLTRDHTWIQEAIDLGTLPAATAHLHPNAHVIRRYLGAPYGVQPDTRLYLRGDESDQQAEANQGLKLRPGDRIVVCSDGLTDLVAAHEILALMRKRPLEQALPELVQLANQRGGHDNITIVGLQIGRTTWRVVRWFGTTALLAVLAILFVSALSFYDFLDADSLFWRYEANPTSPLATALRIEERIILSPIPPTAATQFPEASPTALLRPTMTPLASLQPTATYTPWPTNTPSP